MQKTYFITWVQVWWLCV